VILFATALAGGLDNLPSVVGRGADQPPVYPVPAGDLDGDGLGDLVVGAPADDTSGHEAGAVYVIYDVAGLDPWTPIQDAGLVLTGEEPQDQAGRAVAALGDASGDGLDDVAVSAPEASIVNPLIGKIYLLYGGTVDADGSLADRPMLQGTQRHERVGYRLYGAGDLDQDGRNDLLIGTPYPSASGVPGVGYLGLLFGRDGGWPDDFRLDTTISAQELTTGMDAAWTVLDSETYTGRAATVVPDQTGDGFADLLVGAPGFDVSTVAHRGSSRVDVSGVVGDTADSGSPGDSGQLPGSDTGGTDTGGTDTSGTDTSGTDTASDTGAPAVTTHHAAGAAYLFPFRQRSVLASDKVERETDAIGVVHGENSGDYLPWHLVALADGGVLFTAPESTEGAGTAYVLDTLLGEQHPTSARATYMPSDAAELLGWGAADGHGLGGSKLLLGAPGWSDGAGRIYLVDDVDGSGSAYDASIATLEGCFAGGQAGYHVASHPGPDPHGQDRPWVTISAPGASVYAEGDGAAYVLTAEDLGLLDQGCPEVADDSQVDADGDGYGAAQDCDDGKSWVHPDAPEVCSDGLDDDCDGAVDEACGTPESSGCATAGGTGWWLVLAGLAASTRRRAWLLGALVLAPAAQAKERSIADHTVATLWGSAAYENLHGPVKSGDFDGDGTTDLAVANYQGIAHYYVAGEVQLLQGNEVSGEVWLEEASATIYGISEHDYVGVDLSILPKGSYDGQATDELLIGANHAGLTESDNGQLLVFREPFAKGGHLPADGADLVVRGALKNDRFGSQVKRVGDLDGDGFDDLAIGAPQHDFAGFSESAGRVTVIHSGVGPVEGTLEIDDAATAVIVGRHSLDYAGWRLLGPGDMDGDGYDDLVVGTLGGTPSMAGELHVFLGLPPLGSWEDAELTVADSMGAWASDVATDYAGWGLDGGDVDGDGLAEVVVTAPFRDGAEGRVYLLDGPPIGQQDTGDSFSTVLDDKATTIFEGEPDGAAGYSVAIGPRILVGSPYSSRVWVLNERLVEQDVIVGSDGFGSYVGWLHDFTGDDHDDAVFVSTAATNTLVEQGAAYVVDGRAIAEGTLSAYEDVLVDMDGDGSPAGADCDDGDRRRYPGAEETCGDELDNDCDRVIDEDSCVSARCGAVSTGALVPLLLVGLGLARRRLLLAGLPVLAGCSSPEITLTLPDDTVYGDVAIEASGTELDHLVVLVDGIAVAGGPGPTLEAVWDSRTVDDGEHHVRAVGYFDDDDGLVETVQTVAVDQVLGDHDAPVMSFARPREGGVYDDDAIAVSVLIADATPLTDVTLWADGEHLANLRTEGPWEVLWDTVSPGDHELRAEAWDSAGFVGEATVSFTVEAP